MITIAVFSYLCAVNQNLKDMKKLLVILFMMMPMVSMAQNFNEDGGKYEVYCEVKYTFMSSVLSIEIGDKEYDIINKDKERIKIKNPNEAINLLSKRGWRLVSVVTSGDKNVNRRFFMKKEITDDKEIEFGLQENKKRRY